jgi:triosephosphate isomerase
MSRKPFIGGNWKCNGTKASIKELVDGLNALEVKDSSDVVVSPVSLHLDWVKANLSAPFQVAAQNCSLTGTGAFTGEIAPQQLVDFGLEWVILGHSERRAMFHEGSELVANKVANAQAAGLSVIACIGETLDQREANQTNDVVSAQLGAIAGKVANWDKIVIAYEPVWAIGTGKTATPEQAQEVHAFLRKWLNDNVNADVAGKMRIIYGGSVKPGNAVELFGQADVDGFLVGGASLKAGDFGAIIKAGEQ